jgi:hypothetical protein
MSKHGQAVVVIQDVVVRCVAVVIFTDKIMTITRD